MNNSEGEIQFAEKTQKVAQITKELDEKLKILLEELRDCRGYCKLAIKDIEFINGALNE